jgi:hypothetical protein
VALCGRGFGGIAVVVADSGRDVEMGEGIMSYLLMGETWPKLDPITKREICHACWNLQHNLCGDMFTKEGAIQCDHFSGRGVKAVRECKRCKFECDCVHLSEATWAAQERAQSLDNRRAKRSLEKEALATSPLRAINPKVPA